MASAPALAAASGSTASALFGLAGGFFSLDLATEGVAVIERRRGEADEYRRGRRRSGGGCASVVARVLGEGSGWHRSRWSGVVAVARRRNMKRGFSQGGPW